MTISLSALLGSLAPVGATGATGSQGVQGASGVGLTGATGSQGVQGSTGPGLTSANGDIMPVVAGVSNIGSANNKFNNLYTKSLFLDANTLYVAGVPVLSSSATNIDFSADPNQGLRLTTTGTGNIVVSSNAGTTIQTTGQNADVLVQSSGQGALTRLTSATQVTLTAPTIAVVGNQTVSSNLTVSGNFTVAGNVTSVDSTITNIKDNVITLNKGETSSGVTLNVSGIEVDRGDLARQRLVWNEAAGKWTAGPTLSEVALATETFVNTGLSAKANTDLSNVGTLPDAVINQIRGYTGATGATGVSGASGVAGTNGATGSAGTNGATGVQGASGSAGTNGASGFVGSNGATGSAGTNGATGVTGATGSAGTNGATGVTGATGSAGTNGATGPAGTNGATGSFGGTLTANIAGGGYSIVNVNTFSGNTISITGNVTSGNIITSGTGGSITGANNITASGNITGNNFIGNGSQLTGILNAGITLGTAVASTSGTSIDFTGIPSGVKRITVMFQGVSTNGTSAHIMRLGTSGGFVTSGYASGGIYTGSTTGSGTRTDGLLLDGNASDPAVLLQGHAVLTNISGNSWVQSFVMGQSNSAYAVMGGGSISLAGTLTQIRITMANGTDTFDAGLINIMYE
jgi:hypothetical protein